MTSINTPTLDALAQEIEQARRVVHSIKDYQNENNAINQRNAQLEEERVLLEDKAAKVAQSNSKLQEEIRELRSRLFDAQASISSVEVTYQAQVNSLKEDLELANSQRTSVQLMNKSLGKTINNLQEEVRLLKRDAS